MVWGSRQYSRVLEENQKRTVLADTFFNLRVLLLFGVKMERERGRDVSLCRVAFRNIPTKTMMDTDGSFQVEGWSWQVACLQAPKKQRDSAGNCPTVHCKMCGRYVSLHIQETIGHRALPVPFQLPQMDTAREDRQGIAASLSPRAGNIDLCSIDGNGAQLFVTVIEIREAAFLQLGFSTKHDSTTSNTLSKIFRRFDLIFYWTEDSSLPGYSTPWHATISWRMHALHILSYLYTAVISCWADRVADKHLSCKTQPEWKFSFPPCNHQMLQSICNSSGEILLTQAAL